MNDSIALCILIWLLVGVAALGLASLATLAFLSAYDEVERRVSAWRAFKVDARMLRHCRDIRDAFRGGFPAVVMVMDALIRAGEERSTWISAYSLLDEVKKEHGEKKDVHR